jgi:predicted transposase YbfD/YdcC
LPKKTFEAVEKAKGELIVQIKENQKKLLEEVKKACIELTPLSVSISPVEKNRNRIEQREAAVFQATDYLVQSKDWKKYIACVIQIKRHTEILDTKNNVWETREETSYYAASHLHGASIFAFAIRDHWSCENKHHYVRDVALKEDASRIRKSPGVFARLRSFALNILRFNGIENIQGALFENAINLHKLKEYEGVF